MNHNKISLKYLAALQDTYEQKTFSRHDVRKRHRVSNNLFFETAKMNITRNRGEGKGMSRWIWPTPPSYDLANKIRLRLIQYHKGNNLIPETQKEPEQIDIPYTEEVKKPEPKKLELPKIKPTYLESLCINYLKKRGYSVSIKQEVTVKTETFTTYL